MRKENIDRSLYGLTPHHLQTTHVEDGYYLRGVKWRSLVVALVVVKLLVYT